MVQVLQAKAIFDCNGDEESELTFLEGDILTDVRETSEDGWLHGRLERTGEEGLFPDNYVELIRVETPVQPQPPPQLPSRTSPATKAANVAPLAEAPKPQLPARQTQPAGTRPVPPIDVPANATNRIGPATGPTKVGLPGLGSRSMYGSPRDGGASSPDTQGFDFGRVSSGPPALPKRSNTVHELSPTQERAVAPGPGLSARERMAALSMSSQAARSPLSAAPRPALPPRTSTASSVDSALSPAPSKTDTERKHTYQVPDAAVPVPKLTTFSRPRSARTSKVTSPVEQKITASVTPTVARPVAFERQAISTLNSATGSSPVSKNNLGGLSRSATTGTVRSAGAAHPAHQDPENQNGPLGSAFGVKLNSVGSRPMATAAAAAGSNLPSAQSAPTIAARSSVLQDSSTPPPLPARSNTIATTPPSLAPVGALQRSPMAKLQKEVDQRPFSPPRDDIAARQDDISAQIHQDHQVAKAVAGHDMKTWNQPKTSASYLADALSWHDKHTGMMVSMGTRGATIPPTRLPDASVAERVGITRDARRRYEELFRFVCKGEYIEGAKVHAIYVRSRLDSPTLAQIWDLVDIDNAGRLNKAQFCMGLYLIDERLGTGLIPLEVSDELWVSVMQ
ncbi:Increased rDNA silencing protein [Linnemannia gamsii]|uniref:Increased rDNA silencing protein n=1 Tax=Linnemannia gamsii TaxID=64522 RepID=A0A9P6QU83_9FUNG|nr:Increased rDNA silencing protein [Linnemannia gamsii]